MKKIMTAALFALLLAVPAIAEAIDPASLPVPKRTVLGKYLSAKQAYDIVTQERADILFLDVRTGAELMFVGSTSEIDFQIPFTEMAEPRAWDSKSNRIKLVPNPTFVPDVEAALASKKLQKTSKIIIMCRSGERSAKAVDTLAKAGLTDVWSVVDGFEGDLSKEGYRIVNGWKNAALPWSYKLDKSKLSRLSAPAEQ
jgi:rhodanese-related sulfurtransferase